MREIKFRIYDTKRKEWVHGPGNEVNLFGECILCGELLRRDSDDTNVKLEDLNDMVALQFIGRKDVNGIDVYEGDIVRGWVSRWPESKTTGFIKYNNYAQAFQLRYENCFNGHANEFTHQYHFFEIIGNIYSNPDLLKQ